MATAQGGVPRLTTSLPLPLTSSTASFARAAPVHSPQARSAGPPLDWPEALFRVCEQFDGVMNL
jgi:hypothetical protein